jgi:hypothetical protein
MRRFGRRVSLVAFTAGALLVAPGFASHRRTGSRDRVSTEQLRRSKGMGYESSSRGGRARVRDRPRHSQSTEDEHQLTVFQKQKKMDKVNEWNATGAAGPTKPGRRRRDPSGMDLEGGTTPGAQESIGPTDLA